MDEVEVFNNSEFGQVRTVEIGGEPYFVASDVAKALGYVNDRDAISRHCRWVVKHDIPHPQSKTKTLTVNVIPKGDVVRLAASSELKGAEKFEIWIFDEVIPSVLNHGMYATKDTIDKILDNPDFGIELLTKLKQERAEKAVLREKNNVLNKENALLAQQNLEWTDRSIINAIVRTYAVSLDGGFREAWVDFKKELLYHHGINLNARITNYMNSTGKKTKPKTLDMLDDSELTKALSVAVAMCKQNKVDISDIINKKQAS